MNTSFQDGSAICHLYQNFFNGFPRLWGRCCFGTQIPHCSTRLSSWV